MPEIVVASFNTHAGINGWGREFDVAQTCADLEADVIVLQEAWAPAGPAGDRLGSSHAARVATLLDYDLFEVPMISGVRLGELAGDHETWGPRRRDTGHPRRLILGGSPHARQRRIGRAGGGGGEQGTWGIAIVSRFAMSARATIDLGRLPRDFTGRVALQADLEVEGRRLTVIGTHLAHFSHGSAAHILHLRRELPSPDSPAVLAGDMNLFGPPFAAVMPGWRRAVRARTFPAAHPLVQIDHLLVTRPVRVLEGNALASGDSDHRPVRARIAW